jgi:acyl transferase domain-containing protein
VTRTRDTALLFPGQGSHVDGMGAFVASARPDLFSLVVSELGCDPFPRVEESTRFAQPAIFCASVAALPGAPGCSWMAGHSLGEFAALVAAGSLAVEDALRLVVLRGALMDEAAGGSGAMLALRGPDAWESGTEIAFETGVYPANHNSPTQVVLGGAADAIADAHRVARGRGLRAAVLPVRGAFHTPLMESARAPFAAALAMVAVSPPRVPVMSGVSAEFFGEDVRGALVDALTAPVRWSDVLEALHERGARRFVEVGPGTVLTGLVRRTLADVEAEPATGPVTGPVTAPAVGPVAEPVTEPAAGPVAEPAAEQSRA